MTSPEPGSFLPEAHGVPRCNENLRSRSTINAHGSARRGFSLAGCRPRRASHLREHGPGGSRTGLPGSPAASAAPRKAAGISAVQTSGAAQPAHGRAGGAERWRLADGPPAGIFYRIRFRGFSCLVRSCALCVSVAGVVAGHLGFVNKKN